MGCSHLTHPEVENVPILQDDEPFLFEDDLSTLEYFDFDQKETDDRYEYRNDANVQLNSSLSPSMTTFSEELEPEVIEQILNFQGAEEESTDVMKHYMEFDHPVASEVAIVLLGL